MVKNCAKCLIFEIHSCLILVSPITKWVRRTYFLQVFFTYKILKIQQINNINPSRPNPRQREKINLNFYFHTSLWCLKRFYERLKGLIKRFEAPQRSVKIKI